MEYALIVTVGSMVIREQQGLSIPLLSDPLMKTTPPCVALDYLLRYRHHQNFIFSFCIVYLSCNLYSISYLYENHTTMCRIRVPLEAKILYLHFVLYIYHVIFHILYLYLLWIPHPHVSQKITEASSKSYISLYHIFTVEIYHNLIFPSELRSQEIIPFSIFLFSTL